MGKGACQTNPRTSRGVENAWMRAAVGGSQSQPCSGLDNVPLRLRLHCCRGGVIYEWAQLLSSIDFKALHTSLTARFQELSPAFSLSGHSLPIYSVVTANLIAPPYLTSNKSMSMDGLSEQVRDKLAW